MKILERREIPGLAKLYLAEFPGKGMRMAEFVDTVTPGVPKKDKWVLMISTQFGCPVGCRMCDAGAMGFHGNLTAGEMLDQVRRVFADNPDLDPRAHPKLKIHFARMGEPALNPAVLEALRLLAAGLPCPGLMPSVSTVAPRTPQAEDFLEKLIEVKDAHYRGGRFQLQFSVHVMEKGLREKIVPVPVWNPAEIAAYGKRFVRPGDRKITLNFALPRGERLDAGELRKNFDPALFLIKVTPVNPTRRADLSGSSYVWSEPPAGLAADAAALEAAGFKVILSPSAPEEIAAETSCGQLWASVMKERAASPAAESASGKSGRPGPKPGAAERTLPFDWERCALLVVDMQEFFLDPASPAYMPQAAFALDNAERLTGRFRRLGRPVLFTSRAHEDPAKDGGLMALRWKKVCRAGTPHARVAPSLFPRGGDVFLKCRYSAFTNPALEARLRVLGVDSLVVAGLKTNLCVESTVRAAFDLGFSCVVAADAVAAGGGEFHMASLKSMARGFAAMRTTRGILEEAETACAARAGTKER